MTIEEMKALGIYNDADDSDELDEEELEDEELDEDEEEEDEDEYGDDDTDDTDDDDALTASSTDMAPRYTPVAADDDEDDDEEEKDPALMAEYDRTFSGEDQVEQELNAIKGKVTTTLKEIAVNSIILPKFKKGMRKKSIIGLSGLVSTLSGVVTPIHVMTMEDSDDEYVLMDGTRRLFAAVKSGYKTVNAIIWDFENKAEGRKLANILGLMLNRSQQFKNEEVWETMRILDSVNGCTPGKIEYLLQLNSGDASKMRDVMLAEGGPEVAELREKLLSDEMTIDAAYKKLTALRKKEDRLARDEERELDMGPSAGNDGAGAAGTDAGSDEDAPRPRLNNDEVLELLEMGEEDVGEQTLEDLKAQGDAMLGETPHVQEVGKRHPIDPAIRTATFVRDGFKCRCCGIGGELYLSILVFHHLVPVFAGGPDTVDNGLTLCANCHLTLHNYVDGNLHGDLAKYTEEEQEALKNIFKFGNVAKKAAQKMGLKREQVHELDAESRKHYMPNKNVKDNDASYVLAAAEGKLPADNAGEPAPAPISDTEDDGADE